MATESRDSGPDERKPEAKPPKKRRLIIKFRKKAPKPKEQEKILEPPPPVRSWKIKANHTVVTKRATGYSSEFQEDYSDEENSSESDLEPEAPIESEAPRSGKTLNFADYGDPNPRKRKRANEEETELTPSGRVKRKRSNIEGTRKLEAYDWKMEIVSIVGNTQKKRMCLNLIRNGGLSGGFVTGMANAAQKDGFLAILYDTKETARAAGIFHIEHCGKSSSYVCLSIFATDPLFQKQGLGRMLTAYVITQSLEQGMTVIVMARPEAEPFWTHKTVGFRAMTIDEIRKYARTPPKKKRKKEDLLDLIYDGPIESVIELALLRFRPDDTVLDYPPRSSRRIRDR